MVSHVFPLAALREKEVCLFLTLIIKKKKKKIPATEIITQLTSKIGAILPVAERLNYFLLALVLVRSVG